MKQKQALVISVAMHVVVFLVLGLGVSFKSQRPPSIPIEAKLVIKAPKNKDHLPRKYNPPPKEQVVQKEEAIAQKTVEKAQEKTDSKKPSPDEKSAKKAAKPAASNKANSKYADALKSLSKTFAADLATEVKQSEPEGEVVMDANYFDEIYSLIKESFVVPPHINGPQGRSLRAVLRLYLASDGDLLRMDLVRPSGDDHFDKAVMDGTRRVANFGVVPTTMQNVIRERGIVVELCPFACQDP